MKELPDTRESLLLKIREPENQEAWEEFTEIYRPVVFRLAVARGLQYADAMDLTQTVFIAVADSICRWKKQDSRSRFRHWLLRVAKNATVNALKRRPFDQATGGSEITDQFVSRDAEGAEVAFPELELEYRRQLYIQAADRVRSKVESATWKAFELTAVKGMAVEAAAQELDKSVGAVYAARSRIMNQLSVIVLKLEESYQ